MLIGYMRVSSESDRQTTDLQRDSLINAGVDERHIFEDRMSGAQTIRPGLTKTLEYLKKGDVLVVWKLDRLGRSLPDLLKIIEKLRQEGIGFRSLTESMDTTTPQGELFFHLFGALAQYERSLARERIMAGLKAAEKRGRKGGRPRALNADKIDIIQEMLGRGTSKAHICRTFSIPRSTLNDSLKRIQGSKL